MKSTENIEICELNSELKSFRRSFESLLLATADVSGKPDASYAVYIEGDEACFYVYLSGLAAHAKNLIERPIASVLFIEDESRATQVFARKRLSFECSADMLERDSPEWNKIMVLFVEKHGGLMEMLLTLKDFQLFRLKPVKGRFIKGFGKAYEISGEHMEVLQPVTG